MKILATINKQREGNDCSIHQEFILISFAGEIRMVRFTKYSDEKELYVLSYSDQEIERDFFLKDIYQELINNKGE